jgi:Predicted integral membrane protein (DUF2269)
MLYQLQAAVSEYYSYIKTLHVFSAALWSFSTAVAWIFYLKPAFRAARRRPNDPNALARRNEFMERFDQGAALEHVAFLLLVLTGMLLIWIQDVDLTGWGAISFKFWLGVIVIVPMEAVDIYLSHLGGNKKLIRASGNEDAYERAMSWHWIFFRVTEPIIIILVPLMFVVAIVKPF